MADLINRSLRDISRKRAERTIAILSAAVIMCWPAFWNRFPLIFADTITYISQGSLLASMLIHPQPQVHDWIKSETFSLTLLPITSLHLHHGMALWFMIALNALTTSWVLWLAVRSLSIKSPIAIYLGIVAILSFVTTFAWYVSFAMADMVAPTLCLSVYLAVFAQERLRRWELFTVLALICWSATVYVTYMVLAIGVCMVLALLWLLQWRVMGGCGKALIQSAAVVALALVVQLGLNARLYGRPSLSGIPDPVLMARVIGDGTGTRYLKDHCVQLKWALCSHVQQLPMRENDFLWSDSGVWSVASPAERDELRAEETPFVLAVVRAYPLQQAKRSLQNFYFNLTHFGPDEFYPTDSWAMRMMDERGLYIKQGYLNSKQIRDGMPRKLFDRLQQGTVVASIVLLLLFTRWVIKNSDMIAGLSVITLYFVVVNAFLTGVFSCFNGRYGGRVIWLLPLLALLLCCVRWRPASLPVGSPLADS
jgi:hypothetical protein